VQVPQEYPKAKNALTWAALTYVVAALASIATLVQYILIYMSGSRSRTKLEKNLKDFLKMNKSCAATCTAFLSFMTSAPLLTCRVKFQSTKKIFRAPVSRA